MKARRIFSNDNQTRIRNRYRTIDVILTAFFILSLILVIWGIGIYRKTIIEPKYLFVSICIGTIVATVILLFVTKELLNAFWTFIIAAAIGGGTTYFLTLYLNRELADREITSELFDIQKTGNLSTGKKSSCHSPYGIIDFYGYQKQLIFYCEYEKSIHKYKKVKLDYFKGFFGFPIIQTQTLVP